MNALIPVRTAPLPTRLRRMLRADTAYVHPLALASRIDTDGRGMPRPYVPSPPEKPEERGTNLDILV
jgi:hypothetical protein